MKPVKRLVALLVAVGVIALLVVFSDSPSPGNSANGTTASPTRRVHSNPDSLKDTKTLHAALTGEAAKAELRKSGQYDSLLEALTAARHAVEKIEPSGRHSRGAEYFCANPGQQLRAWFSGDGIELASGIPTSEGEEPWSLRLRLVGVGRGNHLTPVAPGRPSGKGSRVEVEHHEVSVTQWFENHREGLEQGFAIKEPPNGLSGELTMLLEPQGSLQVETTEKQDGVRFVDGNGEEVLHYSGLKAWDATGRILPSRMEVRDLASLVLAVDEQEARYPITIDPLFAHAESKLVQDPVEGDLFGAALALSGEIAVVGAYKADTSAGADAGCAYVFARGGTEWSQETRLTASDGARDDDFGSTVALSGTTVIVGAPAFYESPSLTESLGKAYVFVRSGTDWSEQAALTAADGAIGNRFGWSVSIDGDTALIGASGDDTAAGEEAGSAYVFERSGTTWTQQAKLTVSDGASYDYFGSSVALWQDTALIGASDHDASGVLNAGGAYVFVRNGNQWTQQAKMVASDPTRHDKFGIAVALWDETALVGAPGALLSVAGQGGAYVFVRDGSAWNQQAKLTASDAADYDYFGIAVAIDADRALIGAPGDDTPDGRDAGSAYVFARSGTTWSEQARLNSAGGAVEDAFGTAVAVSGDTALVGIFRADTPAGTDTGRAAIFVLSESTWSQEATLVASEANTYDQFGSLMALRGDTVLIAVPGDDTPAGFDAGSAYTFVRTGTTWARQARLTAGDGGDQHRFGSSVALGDDTALVGAAGDNSYSPPYFGSAYVFVRDGGDWDQQAKLTPSDGLGWGAFGFSVALWNETALIGAAADGTVANPSTGSAYVFTRNGTIWTQQAKLLADDAAGADLFGSSVALEDETALIGAMTGDVASELGAGSAYVFVGSGSIWDQQAKLTASDAATDDQFGRSVALSGDTALVGAFRDDTAAGEDAGTAYVFVRTGSDWTEQARLTASDAGAFDQLGLSLALSGDTALVGAPLGDTAGIDTGSAYLFVRNGAIWSERMKLTAGVDASYLDRFGHSTTLFEDTIIISSPLDDSGGLESGSVYVFRVGELPEIVRQPHSRSAIPGESVTFSVLATGHEPLTHQWRKDGYLIEGATGNAYTISSAQTNDEGLYDCVVSNLGGVVTSAPATLTVNNLSQFERTTPRALTDAGGFVIINLTPQDIGAAWRFVGEELWRASGLPVGGMPTGSRMIEFRPVPGWDHPDPILASIASGGSPTFITRPYSPVTMSGNGELQVELWPPNLASEPLIDRRAQWRLHRPGKVINPWLDSGDIVTGLVPGDHQIECKWIEDWITPTLTTVTIADGTPIPVSMTYRVSSPGISPGVLPYETVSTSEELPYAHVGQIRSDVGTATGFVVRNRVVATAGHVVFDDQTLSATTGVAWLFQRDRGTNEPDPLIPRGHHLMTGYATQRETEINAGGEPGVSSTASQELDVAALWFFQEAGRGGFSGFLASNAVPDPQGNGGNEWLRSDALKILVGYPVEGIQLDKIGRMHATAAANATFTAGGSPHTYTTTGIRSGDGNSGGPLCVRIENPGEDAAWYPAAVYLGGSDQVVVRAIDDQVVELFNSAEAEGNGGDNSVGGGITHSSTTQLSTNQTDPGALRVAIAPSGTETADAAWRMSTEASFVRRNGQTLAGLAAGWHTVQFNPVSGFIPPAPQDVEILGGRLLSITFTYAAENDDDDGDGFSNLEESIAGTDLNDPNEFLKIATTSRSGTGFTVTALGKAGRTYELEASNDPASDSWTVVAIQAILPANATVTLTDNNPAADKAFYRIRAGKP